MATATAEPMSTDALGYDLLTLDFGGGDDYDDEYASEEEDEEEMEMEREEMPEKEYDHHSAEEYEGEECEEYVQYHEETTEESVAHNENDCDEEEIEPEKEPELEYDHHNEEEEEEEIEECAQYEEATAERVAQNEYGCDEKEFELEMEPEKEEIPEKEYGQHSEEKESEEYEQYYEQATNKERVAQNEYNCVHDDEEEKEEEEVARPSNPLSSSSSMAAAVAAAAMKRNNRLDSGGSKRMTVIHDEQEYRQQFISVAAAAAEMGRLTHLPEEVVVAIVPSKDKLGDSWSGPSGILSFATATTTFLTVIHEAAKAGNARKLPEHVASNYEEDDDPYRKISPRLQQLLELNKRVGTGQQKVDTYIKTMKEKEQEWAPKTLNLDLDQLELPKKKPPKFVKKRVEDKPGPTPCIHMMAAEKAWARRERLDRPGAELKVTCGCPCPYCGDPNPFQTYAYREKRLRYREQGYESESSEDTVEPPPPPSPIVSQAKKYVPKGNQFKKSDNLPVWPPPDPNAKKPKQKVEQEAPPEPTTADTGCSCVIL